MSVVMVSFRITRDSSEDYDKRYKAITEKIKSYTNVMNRWDGTTSFYLFETTSKAADIASGVYMLDQFRSDKEEVVAINLSDKKDHGRYGKVGDVLTLDKLLAAR